MLRHYPRPRTAKTPLHLGSKTPGACQRQAGQSPSDLSAHFHGICRKKAQFRTNALVKP